MSANKEDPAKHSPPLEGCPQDGVGNENIILTYINSTAIYRNFRNDLPANHDLKYRARALRKAGNLPEVIFWQQVHKRKFHKIDFDRQRIIGNYIVDFYVKTLSLIIEIDGSSHDNKKEYDGRRENYLKELGLSLYRINANDVRHDVDRVMRKLEIYVMEKHSGNGTNQSLGCK